MSYFEIIKYYMQFHKKTSIGRSNFLMKVFIRTLLACLFFPDFITFFIEKTQICLILKLSKFICNLLKKQVQAEVLLE